MEIKKKRGLALLSPEKRREIASKGGKAAPNNFKNNKEFASLAGKRSQQVQREKRGK